MQTSFCRRLTGRRRRFIHPSLLLACGAALSGGSALAAGPYGTVSFSGVASGAYGTQDTNACAVNVNDLVTIGGFQFITYYNSAGKVVVGRRATSAGANNANPWTLVTTSFIPDAASGGIADDHHTISLAVDGNGAMHLSWGMHNDALNYAITSNSVTGSTFAPAFVQQSQTQLKSWFGELSTVNQVTYPQFYNVPGTGNILFVYRDAASASGGGSGNGNEYFATYNAATKQYVNNTQVLNGGQTSVNGYLNNLAYTPSGQLDMTWTWRATPNWQTNFNLMYAQSSDNGLTWYHKDGATQYALPIISDTSAGGTAAQVGQVVDTIPQGSSYINQAAEAIDNNGNPMVCTFMAPGWTPTSATGGSGNPNRQYVLFYYNGSSWQRSTISNRTSDSGVDFGGGDVRDLARPLVMVDQSNRVIVVTRSEDSSMGSYANPATPNNGITIYYTTTAALDAGTPNWRSVALDTTNLGAYEPNYDPVLWSQSNLLNLLFEPVGLTGETTNTVQVLQWDEPAFFAAGLTWNNTGGTGDGATWDNIGNANFNNGGGAVNFMTADNVTFNDANNGHYAVTLNSTVTPASVIFNNSTGNYTITGTGGIAGTGGLTKNGTGSVTLSTVNTYTGTTAINAGAFTLSAGGSIAGHTFTVANGATFNVNGSIPSNSNITTSGTVNVAGNTGASPSVRSLSSLSVTSTGFIKVLSSTSPAAPVVLTISDFSLLGSSQLDLTNNELLTNSLLSTIRSKIIAGQITSSTAGGVIGSMTAGAQTEARFTLIGDTNLDLTVDVSDLGNLATNFGVTAGGTWQQGDFDYSGTVNVADLGDLASNFGQTLGGGSSASAAQSISAASTAIPEPATLAIFLTGGFASLLHRRRKAEV